MPRPEKDDADRKRLRSYYSTDTEQMTIKQAAKSCGLSVSAFVLMAALTHNPPKP